MNFFGRASEAPEASLCLVQTLFETPQTTCGCCRNWSQDAGSAGIDEDGDDKAVVARMRRSHGEGRAMALDSVVVQSETLKRTLREVFEGYKGLKPSLKRLVFKAPFHAFYFRWQHFAQILDRQKKSQPVAATYSQLLYDVLHDELQADIKDVKALVAKKSIRYRHLWALFEPGERAISTRDGVHQFYIVNYCAYRADHMELHARCVDWDGLSFGYADRVLRVDKFAGTRYIAELEVFPAAFHPLSRELELQAIARGQKFQKLVLGTQHKAYDGVVKYAVAGRKLTRTMKGRIVLDKVAYMRENGKSLDLAALTPGSIMPELNVSDYQHVRPGAVADQAQTTSEGGANYDKIEARIKAKRGLTTKSQDLTERQQMLCAATVNGFFLELNRWATFEVDSVAEIEWDDEVFSTLLLPDGYKSLMLSIMHDQSGHMPEARQQLEQSRGRGINILLAGPAGTGKSFTVEAVAEHMRKPLYVLSAAELGGDARVVEERLQTVLELAERWKAILLLDDVDVFLQERTVSSPSHNEVVGVALRLFDFYKGLMFLTSNRPETIDGAMQARTNLTLNYPDLDEGFRENIWKQLLWALGQANTLSNDDFSRLRSLELNGRQIKNVAKFAVLFATREREAFCMQHIELVLEATQNGLQS